MTNRYTLLGSALLALGLVLAGPVQGGTTPEGCENLDDFDPVANVDFDTEIQPILDTCTGCHGKNGTAGLDLRPGHAYDNLVEVVATSNPERYRVEPFNPDESNLFLAINCESPGGPGFQMSGTTLDEQALIRDWIDQGALPEGQPEPPPPPVSIPVMGGPGLVLLSFLMALLGGLAVRRFV